MCGEPPIEGLNKATSSVSKGSDAPTEAVVGTDRFVLTVRCADGIGVIATVAKALADCNANVTEAATYADSSTGQFFMRSEFEIPADPHAKLVVDAALEFCRVRRNMTIEVFPMTQRSRVLLMVSKTDHCLNDLLYRHRVGEPAIDIPAVVSNHPDLRALVEWHSIPFIHMPVTRENRDEQDAALPVTTATAYPRCDRMLIATLPSPPDAPVTRIGRPHAGVRPWSSSRMIASIAVRPAVPTAIARCGVMPCGKGTSQSPFTRARCACPPQRISPTRQPVRITASPGASPGWVV